MIDQSSAVHAAHFAPGALRLHPNFRSQFLPNDRTIVVSLPSSYEYDLSSRYSVLYMHDGQNLFDGATSFIPGQIWAADATGRRLATARTAEPLIFVGIYNTGDHRVDEYTPTVDGRLNRGGQSALYGRFIVEELMPFVNHTYRTRTGPESTGLAGSSLGGLATLDIGLRYPHVFGKLAAMSPSVWWDQSFIIRAVESMSMRTPQRVWLDIGTSEGRGILDQARRLRDVMVGKGWRLDDDLLYREAYNGRHTELAWARRVSPMLRFLFPGTRRSCVRGRTR